MHHVALDRPGADDRHLDDEVVEGARPHPRQEVHLARGSPPGRPRGCRRGRACRRPPGPRPAASRGCSGWPVWAASRSKRLADAGEHAEGEDVDLEDAEGVDVVLVPADDGAVLHRRVLDRHELVEPALGDDEAADVLGEVAGEADDLLDELDGQGEPAVGRVEAELATRSAGRLPPPQPQICEESAATVSRREAHRGADLADRPLAAVVDDGGAEAGAVAAVAVVDVLDHLLAALVLEVDVDVGRLVAGLGDEALEDHGADLGRDRGDAERVADDRVRRRAAALAEDVLAAGVVDDVADGEEVGGVVSRPIRASSCAACARDLLRHAVGIAPPQPLARSAVRAAPAGPRPPRSPSDTRSAARRARSCSLRRSRPPRCTAASWPAKSRSISASGRRRRSALGSAARPMVSMRRPSRMQVSTSTSRRRLRVVHDRLGRGDERQAERRGQPRRPGRCGAVLPVVARARRRDARGGARGRRRGHAAARRAGRAPGRQMQEQVRGRPRPVEVGEVGAGRSPFPVAARAEGQQPAEPAPAGAVAGRAVTSSPSARQSRAAGSRRGTVAPSRASSRSAWWARTRPATELRSAMAKAAGRARSPGRRTPAGGCRR